MARHKLMINLIDGLPKINPVASARPKTIGRNMVAAAELDIAGRYAFLCILRSDLVIEIHLKPVLFPRAGFRYDVKQNQMAR
jgi:hypothetical protein